MIARLARTTVRTMARNWLRKRLFFVAKLPIMALGLAAILLTTDLLDTLKTMWVASNVAADTYKQAIQTKQQ